MSRRPTTSCAMPASTSPRRIFSDRRGNAWETAGLRLAALRTNQIGGGAASGHLALQLLEAPACGAFAIVDHLDRGFPRHRPVDDRRGIFPDGQRAEDRKRTRLNS